MASYGEALREAAIALSDVCQRIGVDLIVIARDLGHAVDNPSLDLVTCLRTAIEALDDSKERNDGDR